MNDDDRSRIAIPDLRRCITPLRLVFWGGVLNVVDIRVNDIDLVSDLLGTTLMLVGLWKLSGIRVDAAYRKGLLFATLAAALSLVGQLFDFAPPQVRRSAAAFVEFAGFLEVVAVAIFAVMMARLAKAAELPDVAADWRRTLKWFLFCFVAPVGLLRAGATLWVLAGRPRFTLPDFPLSFWLVAILLFFAMLLVPWIRLFMSTSRLRKALQLKAWSRSVRERKDRASRSGSPGRPSSA
jgi:uncharacterized membrane protein